MVTVLSWTAGAFSKIYRADIRLVEMSSSVVSRFCTYHSRDTCQLRLSLSPPLPRFLSRLGPRLPLATINPVVAISGLRHRSSGMVGQVVWADDVFLIRFCGPSSVHAHPTSFTSPAFPEVGNLRRRILTVRWPPSLLSRSYFYLSTVPCRIRSTA